MKIQAIFLKKILKCRLLQFLFGASRVNNLILQYLKNPFSRFLCHPSLNFIVQCMDVLINSEFGGILLFIINIDKAINSGVCILLICQP